MTPRIHDSDLLAHLRGDLPPDREVEVESALAAFPALRARLEALDRRRVVDDDRVLWLLPPPGRASGSRGLDAGELLLDVAGERLRPGDRFVIVVRGAADLGGRRIGLLWRGAGPWELVMPTSAEETLTLDDLEREGDGWRVELAARPGPVVQRWAVVLLPDELDVSGPGLADRLRHGLLSSTVDATVVQVEVAPA